MTWCYIAGPADGLVIADVSDQRRPRVVAYLRAGRDQYRLCFRSIAYAGTQSGELHILNVTDPAQPVHLSTYTGGSGMSLMVACWQDVVYFSTLRCRRWMCWMFLTRPRRSRR